MKLSIITINFNNRDGLKKTIDSVVCQTFRDFEWIVIDGGSADGSRELIEQYADHFSYWVSEPDKGIYNAMNKGVMVAKGEYLQFLNSGDWLCDETALDRCFAHEFVEDIAFGNVYSAMEGKGIGKRYQPEVLTFKTLLDGAISHSASFIKREILLSELYDENLRIVSDWKFFLRQALRNRSFVHIEEHVTYFDVTGISATNEGLNRREREKVLREEVSSLILADYEKMDAMEARLNETRVKNIMQYCAKNVAYRKIITASLLLVELIDRVLSRRNSK